MTLIGRRFHRGGADWNKSNNKTFETQRKGGRRGTKVMAKIRKTVSGENSLKQRFEGRSAGILRHALNSLRRFERLRMTGFGLRPGEEKSCRRFAQMHADQKKMAIEQQNL